MIQRVIFALVLAFAVWSPDLALASGGGGDMGPRHFYERVRGLTVNVVSRARIRGQLTVNLRLESDSVAKAERIRQLQPRLRDAYNRVLTRTAQRLLDIRRPLDLERLEANLQRATDNILEGGIARVLIVSAIVSPS